MLIIDAQIHLWGQGGRPNPIHGHQIASYSAEEALKDMAQAGIDAAIIHPPAWDPHSHDLAIAAAEQYPSQFAVLGQFRLDDPASRNLVATWRARPGMLGLRFFLQPQQQIWLTDGTMDWLWPAAEEAGVPVGLCAPDHLRTLAAIAERHPRLKLIIDHLGALNGKKDSAAFAHLDDIVALAKYPGVAIKASGAPAASTDPYPYRNIHAYIERIFDAFGPKRFFWGTDITRMPCTWRQCVTLFTEQFDFLMHSDKELIMGRALSEFLDWTPGARSDT